jgi:Na+-transporting NADH:ubiquinone oxidoreductase subunit B
MKRLRKLLDNVEPLFVKGGRFERFHAMYEMVDTLFYSPPDVTRGSPHIRDAIDLKRVMIMVVFAATPAALVGMWNTGFQANTAIAAMGIDMLPGWRETILLLLGGGHDPASFYDNFLLGALYFVPIYAVTMAAGGFWEMLFSGVRNHEINEGFFVTSFLFTLILPATIPLWQVAIGISFGVVIGKEVFGGTGKNVLNPALVGRAFLYFAYPAQISGDAVWTTVDGFSGATALGISALEGVTGVVASGLTWTQAFLGQMQGSIGETSFAGLIIPVALVGLIDSGNPMMNMPWHWHIVLGGFAFGAIFMATDPVSACQTNRGKLIYGLLIGFLTFVIRVINPAFPEGIMLAILFGNVFSPMIDYFVVNANIKRRVRRSG